MISHVVFETFSQDDWNHLVSHLAGSHILQSWEWGKIKSNHGWTPAYHVWKDESGTILAAALLLERAAGLPIIGLKAKILYAPRGPLLDWRNVELRLKVIDDLEQYTRQRKAIFLKIDPDLPVGFGIPGTEKAADDPSTQDLIDSISSGGWKFSHDQVQFKNSIWLDLQMPEQQILANMKQKTRYNIRLSERKGILVRQGSSMDLDILYNLYRETAVRDNFIIRSKEYYIETWKTMLDNHKAVFLIAEYEKEPVGAIILFLFSRVAWYFYGMSSPDHREKMPNHLLQWEAIRTAKSLGCTRYDFWGAPDVFDESDSMWGVFRFKDGFNGKIVRTIGAWDFPARPLMYSMFTKVIPAIMSIMRGLRKSYLQRETS